jgi:hypothetical protein
LAISFDAANHARDLLMQVRSTLEEVGDPKIGWIANRWGDGARRAKLGEASRQVGEAADLLRTYGVTGSRYEQIGMAALDRLRTSIDELRVDERRVAKVVGRGLEPDSWGDPFRRNPRNLDERLLHAELTALELPLRAAWSKVPQTSRPAEEWIAYGDALHASAANILHRSDDELSRADLAALERIGFRSQSSALYLDFPTDDIGQPITLRWAKDRGAVLADIRRWNSPDVATQISGDVFTSRRAWRVLEAAQQVIDEMPADVPAPIATLRAETLELMERNTGRIDGTRRDTYGRNPDYAEIGRIRENLALLQLGGTKAAAPERLTW